MTNTFGFNKLKKGYSNFVVKNIAFPPKTITIFNLAIPSGKSYNLMDLNGIGEEDIRISLLKGELLNKLTTNNIEIVNSDVNLLQFNDLQKQLLYNYNIGSGVQVKVSNYSFLNKINVPLFGNADGINSVFVIPNTGNFVVSDIYNITIYWNGVRQLEGSDYTVLNQEIIMTVPPGAGDSITADYFIDNS